jgi:hypothetical protein
VAEVTSLNSIHFSSLFISMFSPVWRKLSPIFLFLTAASAQTNPADQAVSAVMKLRAQPEYTWEVSMPKSGDPSLPAPARTVRGAMTDSGEMVVEQIWADGLVLESVSRKNGVAVVRTPEGWLTKTDIDKLLARPKPGQSKWIWFANEALEAATPEEQLTQLLNDSTGWERKGDVITATLTQRGASFWLGSGRLVPNATGKMQLRLHNGFVQECRFSAEGDQPQGASRSSPITIEYIFTFNYSARAPSIAEEAKRKLDSSSVR